MKKLKIIHTVYGDASGGRWQAMLNTFDALASKGHEGVLVYGEENKNLKSENYPKFYLNSSGFYDLLASVKLALWLRSYRPDVVIAHSGRAVYLFKNAMFFARIKCPVIAMNHSHNVKRTVRADGFIHITPYVAQCVADASKKKGIDLTKKPQAIISNLIHVPDNLPSLSKSLGQPVVLGIMTRLVEYKGTHLAISAVEQLKRQGYKVKLLIAGEGEQKKALIQQVKDLNLESEVEFLGWIGGKDKSKFYKDIDIALVPTMNDTQPLAILDAFAWGKPVVASDHISVEQIIRQGENGLMAKCGEVDSLANNIAFLIEHPEQLCKVAQGGYVDAKEKYQFKIIAQQYDQFITTLKL
ncbi:glycosyltransferase family 4 protein [Acinetobacter tibetensis]|uniref:Glycosyltransferase family 4 protein n=1 Tax=Acinetobacter tibetensis TaxID=2943497 RepID=A0AAE9LQI7_9GAMM|nr:glycosyltransferase family 4 protein [Acinetobacter tibetensis]USE82798.1 glycosyltransferase family 4 protein [Acinetobacter tibetensis]